MSQLPQLPLTEELHKLSHVQLQLARDLHRAELKDLILTRSSCLSSLHLDNLISPHPDLQSLWTLLLPFQPHVLPSDALLPAHHPCGPCPPLSEFHNCLPIPPHPTSWPGLWCSLGTVTYCTKPTKSPRGCRQPHQCWNLAPGASNVCVSLDPFPAASGFTLIYEGIEVWLWVCERR